MLAIIRLPLVMSLVVAASGSSCLDMFKDAASTSPTAAVTTSAFGGSWTSVAVSTSPQTCTNFQWAVTDISLTGVSGTFKAVCYGSVQVSGTASGALDGTRLNWTATGTGTAPTTGSCPVALAGSATLEGNQIRIPYSGTTCLGPVAGTELLRKPS
jgi:hypothetical protein